MTIRAFIIGLFCVAIVAAVTPYNDYFVSNTYFTGYHFPAGVFFLLLFLTLGVNVLIKLIRRAWALRQSELMLVWCMALISSTVPASGLMRYWFGTMSAPAYYGKRLDLSFYKDILEDVPEGLVLSTDPESVAVKRFFEGRPTGEKVRIYFARWLPPMLRWAVFIGLFYMATLFFGSLLRKQWVDSERLIFPLARVPLELTEGSGERNLLPALLHNRAFLIGAALTFVFGLMRASPALRGAQQGWLPTFPVQSILWDTPISQLGIYRAYIFPIAIGFAFLVPADVALSMWFFFFFIHIEHQASYWFGVPFKGGITGHFLSWQQAGSFVVFTLMMFWAARHHLSDVFRKAIGRGRDIDDSTEPVSYRASFWGLVIALLGMVGWFWYYGMNPLVAGLLLGLMFCIVLGQARLIAQGGVFFIQQTWAPPSLLHSLSGGRVFGAQAAIVAQMQQAILIADSRELLSGHVMNAFRISSVFRKHRRWFLPALMAALLVGVVICTWSTLRVYYDVGGVNISNTYGTVQLPKQIFQNAQQMYKNPTQSAEPYYGAMAFGAAIMFVVTFMRARFYWWPVHSLGLLIGNTWPMQNLWFGFLLGWLVKVAILKFGSGGALRGARHFFLGVIIGESAVIGLSTLLGLVAKIKLGYIFLPG